MRHTKSIRATGWHAPQPLVERSRPTFRVKAIFKVKVDCRALRKLVVIVLTIHAALTAGQSQNGEAGGDRGTNSVELRHVSVARGSGGISVELTLSGSVNPVVTTVDSPTRVVVDLPKTVVATQQHRVAVGWGGAKAVRIGMDAQQPPTTRVVVDLTQSLEYEIAPGAGHNLVLKLHPSSANGAKSSTGTGPVARRAHESPVSPVANPWLLRGSSTEVSDEETEPQPFKPLEIVQLRNLVPVRRIGELTVEFKLTGPVVPQLSTVDLPAKLVVDLPGTMAATPRWRIPVGSNGVKTLRIGMDGKVPPTTRVVVDLSQSLDYEISHGVDNELILSLRPSPGRSSTSIVASNRTETHAAPVVAPLPSSSAQPPADNPSVAIPPDQPAPASAPAPLTAEGRGSPVLTASLQPPASPVAAPIMKSALAAIVGVVADKGGGVIPTADLTLVERTTSAVRHTVSDNLGNFSFKDLSPGHYLLRAKAEDMQSAEKEIAVEGNAISVKLQMKVSIEEQVNVNANAPDPVSDNNSDAVDLNARLLRGLPTDSQNILPLLSNFVAPAAGGTEGISLVVDGMEADQIDDLPASAIKEVAINHNPYAVEFRRPGKARIEITTKHGSLKRYHGHFGVFARDSVFDANSAFAIRQPDLSRKLFEESLGGPLGPKGAAFFFSGQHLGNTESAIVNATVLSPGNQPVALIENVPTGLQRSDYVGRLDFQPGHVHHFTAFYGFDEKFETNDSVGGFNLPDRGYSTGQRGHKFQFMDQAIVSPTLLNTSRLLVRRSSLRDGNLASSYAINVNGSFSSGPAQTAYQQRETLAEFEDVVTLARKNHTFRFGGGTRTRMFAVTDQSNFGGTYRFSSLDTYSQRAPYVFTINQGQPNATFTIREATGFAQDEVRLRSSVSLVTGLRYDWQSTITNARSLAPRLAFAYSPGGLGTVFRAGAGIFYEYLPRTATEQALLLDGTHIQQVVVTNPSYPNPFTNGATLPTSVERIAPNLTTPYVLQVGASLEQALGKKNQVVIEFQNLRGFHLLRSRDINAPLPTTGMRPNADFFAIDQVESTAFLRSQALTMSYRGGIGKRFHGIAQYTFGKVTDDTSGPFSLPADNYNLGAERGRADYDRRHQVSLAGLLNLPAAFRVGTVLHVGSGIPYNITTGRDDNHDSVANDRPAGVTRNTGLGPGLLQLDMRLTKLFAVWRPTNRERSSRNLDFSIDAFNVLNHANYPNFVGVMTSPYFGRPNTALPARTIQTSLGYRF